MNKKIKILFYPITLLGIIIMMIYFTFWNIFWAMLFQNQSKTSFSEASVKNTGELSTAYFAGGCFWCMEWIFEAQEGVSAAISGYMWGSDETANYKDVSSGKTWHREWVKIEYYPEIISYETLVELYWTQIDPTDPDGQFADRGFHYTTAIYYWDENEKNIAENSKQNLQNSWKFEKEIVTKILPAWEFYPAEEYHQDYYKKSAFRYNLYKKWSGREDFIDKNWKDELQDLTLTLSSKEREQATKSPWEILEATYSDSALRKRLTPLQYKVTQEGGTERAFDNEYWDNKRDGIYVDIIDGTPLFSSEDKYDSGTGWPSFVKPISPEVVTKHEDRKLFSVRTEIKSASSSAHLGHVFPDGPKERGWLRYCMNSAALRFIPLEDLEAEGYGEYVEMFE